MVHKDQKNDSDCFLSFFSITSKGRRHEGSVLRGLGEERLVFTSKLVKLHLVLESGAADA